MKEIEKILKITDVDKRQEELKKLCTKYGVSLDRAVNGMTGRYEEPILIERIQQACANRIASKTWVIAIISAVAAVIGAVGAWVAVFK